MDEHEAALPFPNEYDNGGKFSFLTFYLRVRPDTYFQFIAGFVLPSDGFFHSIFDRKLEVFAIEPAPKRAGCFCLYRSGIRIHGVFLPKLRNIAHLCASPLT